MSQFQVRNWMLEKSGAKEDFLEAAREVLESGRTILGPKVAEFESAWAAFCGTKHCVSVANGTEAIEIALRGLGIGRGHKVLTVSLTAVATVAAIMAVDAEPVFVDVDPGTLTMDPKKLGRSFLKNVAAVIPVHLYGQPAKMNEIRSICLDANVPVIEDCAHAHGARYEGRPVGSIGAAGAFSFYPTKILGAIGDAGAIVTDDVKLAERMRKIRTYGAIPGELSSESGCNSRMDEVQAAYLLRRLAKLPEAIRSRQRRASLYRLRLRGLQHVAPLLLDRDHVWHLFVVRVPDGRDDFMSYLKSKGIETRIHYIPAHRHPAYRFVSAPRKLDVTDQVCREVVSLPLFEGITTDDIEMVCKEVRAWDSSRAR